MSKAARDKDHKRTNKVRGMSQIEELQSRILTAMERIGAGVEAVSAARGAAQAEDAGIAQALDDERMANAQLEERLRALKEKHAAELTALEDRVPDTGAADPAELEAMRAQLEQRTAEMTAQAKAMAALDSDLQRLRKANDELRAANAALREANEAGVGEPHLINKAMLAELEGLRATQAAQASEANAVLSRLTPLLANARNLPEGEEA